MCSEHFLLKVTHFITTRRFVDKVEGEGIE